MFQEEPKTPERFWPFSGYDMGDNMIQAFGMTSSMYPADGGQVRVDKCHFMEGLCFPVSNCAKFASEVRWCSGYHVCFTRRRSRVRTSLGPHSLFCVSDIFHVLASGTTTIRTTVLKDGHTFVIHVLDPKLETDDQPEPPTPPPTPPPEAVAASEAAVEASASKEDQAPAKESSRSNDANHPPSELTAPETDRYTYVLFCLATSYDMKECIDDSYIQ